MPKLTQTHIALILLLCIVVIGVFLFGPQKLFRQIFNTQKQTAEVLPVLSITGKIGVVNVGSNSFALLNAKGEKESTVRVGSNTKIVQLVFPFDLKNPPANKTFTPERKPVALKDLKAGDQVFIRASQPIKTGQDVINPIEIQILP